MARQKRDFKTVSAQDAQHILESKPGAGYSAPKKIADVTRKARSRAIAAWTQ